MAASTSSVILGTKPELRGGHPRGAWAVLRNSEPGAGSVRHTEPRWDKQGEERGLMTPTAP